MLNSTCLLIFVLGMGLANDACPKKNGGVVIRAVQESLNDIAQEFEIRDRVESQLVFGEFMGGNGQLDQTTVSITILRPGKPAVFTYSKRFDDRWTLLFNRAINSDVKSPIAIITRTSVIKEKPVVTQKLLRYDTDRKWHVVMPKSP